MVFVKKWLNTSNSATYRSWSMMISRCYNKNNKDYYNYGARGIKVCDEWRFSYDNFFDDMGERPKPLTLDRINPDGNYELTNCRWASAITQANNTSKNIFIKNEDKIQSIAEWSRLKNINASTIAQRIRSGKSLDKVFNTKKLKPDNYNHLKNLSRKDNTFIEFKNKKLSIAQWSEFTGINHDTIWHRIFTHKWTIEKSLTCPPDRVWSHGTNTGYSKYKCRCAECTEYNRIKSKRARDALKLKKEDKK